MKNKVRLMLLMGLPLTMAISAGAQSKVITTICGNGTGAYGGDGGTATAAKLKNPSGIAVNDSGYVYIADRDNARVRRITKSGLITTIGGNGTAGYTGNNTPATTARIAPAGIAVDDTGNVYIAEPDNNCVRKISKSGMLTLVAGNNTAGFMGDNGPATAAELSRPVAVALDGEGNIYISDQTNNRVRMVSSAGIITTVAGGGSGSMGNGGPATAGTLSVPAGIAVDKVGSLYITDQGNNMIRKVASTGIISGYAGTGSVGYSGDGGAAIAAKFNYPVNVAADDSGNVYVVEGNANVIRKINAIGNISTVAGSNSPGFSGDDGAATAAKINNPAACAVDSSGKLYIADMANNRVRKVAPKSHTAVQAVVAGVQDLRIIPNPNTGAFTVDAALSSAPGDEVSMTVTDMAGRTMYQGSGRNVAGRLSARIELPHAPAGVYLLSLKTANEVFAINFLVQ